MAPITRILAVAMGLLGAVVASQGPEFSQQYRQRIGGGIDELRQVVGRFDADARTSGETPEGAIARLQGNPDDVASRQGAAMQAHRQRLERLEAHRQAMIEAGPFKRIVLMVREGDAGIIDAAYRDFEPAVPVTQEGILSAGTGFIVVWGGILVLAGFIRSLFRPRRPRAAQV